jgi:hypothetical protein
MMVYLATVYGLVIAIVMFPFLVVYAVFTVCKLAWRGTVHLVDKMK